MVEYTVYKGEDCITIGTAKECAIKMGVKPDYIQWMTTPTGKKRFETRKNKSKCTTAVKLEEEK